MMSYLRAELPPIALHSGDLERLGRLANAALERYPQTAGFLAREVARADIVTSLTPPRGLVIMGSKVEFSTDGSDQTRCVTLVYPDQADTDAGQVSVLTPIGAALIGLSVGQSIEWQRPSGAWSTLTVVRVDWGGE
jgi:regulator of nucleoside diphosphate kinase